MCVRTGFAIRARRYGALAGEHFFSPIFVGMAFCSKNHQKKAFFIKRLYQSLHLVFVRAPQNRQSLIVARTGATLYPVDTSMLPVSTKARPLTGLSTKKPPLLGGFFLPVRQARDRSQLHAKAAQPVRAHGLSICFRFYPSAEKN